jgi:hypothetical protein
MFKIVRAGEPIPDETCYILTKKGIFLKKKMDIMESIIPVQEISFLEEMKCYAKMNIKSMKKNIFNEILSVFRWVFYEFRSECQCILHYNTKNKKWIAEIPNQEVSVGSISYESDLQFPGYLRIGTIHSHGSMSAFHSSTDIHDEENWDGIHITIGNVNSDEFTVKSSIVTNGNRFVVDPLEYIVGLTEVQDNPLKKNNYRFDDFEFDFPEKWKDQIQLMKPDIHKGFTTGNFIADRMSSFVATNTGKSTNQYVPMNSINPIPHQHKLPCDSCMYGNMKFMREVMEDDDSVTDDPDDPEFFDDTLRWWDK